VLVNVLVPKHLTRDQKELMERFRDSEDERTYKNEGRLGDAIRAPSRDRARARTPERRGEERVSALRARRASAGPTASRSSMLDGRLEVVAYAESPAQLPAELGPWIVEASESDWAERLARVPPRARDR